MLTKKTNASFHFLLFSENLTKSVAFYARTNRDPFDVGSQDIVILNDVITNVGQAYNENTGVFTTPYNGRLKLLGLHHLTDRVIHVPTN